LVVDLENDVVGPACLTHGGEILNARVREVLGLPPLPTPSPASDPPVDAPDPESSEEDS